MQSFLVFGKFFHIISKVLVKKLAEKMGTFKVDPAFEKAPKSFLDFASTRWEIFKEDFWTSMD